jgi:hypothetical protein
VKPWACIKALATPRTTPASRCKAWCSSGVTGFLPHSEPIREKITRIWTADYRQHHGLRAVQFSFERIEESTGKQDLGALLPATAHSAPISSQIGPGAFIWRVGQGHFGASPPMDHLSQFSLRLRCTQAGTYGRRRGPSPASTSRNSVSRALRREKGIARRIFAITLDQVESTEDRSLCSGPSAHLREPSNWLSRDDNGRKTLQFSCFDTDMPARAGNNERAAEPTYNRYAAMCRA